MSLLDLADSLCWVDLESIDWVTDVEVPVVEDAIVEAGLGGDEDSDETGTFSGIDEAGIGSSVGFKDGSETGGALIAVWGAIGARKAVGGTGGTIVKVNGLDDEFWEKYFKFFTNLIKIY